MIWVDGYKWPPDLRGTGREDSFNQAWGRQSNTFLRNGLSIYENDTHGYQSSYVFHVENPVRFEKEIKATIEHGYGNHLANEMSFCGLQEWRQAARRHHLWPNVFPFYVITKEIGCTTREENVRGRNAPQCRNEANEVLMGQETRIKNEAKANG